MNNVLLSLMTNTQKLLDAIEQGSAILQVAVANVDARKQQLSDENASNEAATELDNNETSETTEKQQNDSNVEQLAGTDDIVKLSKSIAAASTIGKQSLLEAINYVSKVNQSTEVFVKSFHHVGELPSDIQGLLKNSFGFIEVTGIIVKNSQDASKDDKLVKQSSDESSEVTEQVETTDVDNDTVQVEDSDDTSVEITPKSEEISEESSESSTESSTETAVDTNDNSSSESENNNEDNEDNKDASEEEAVASEEIEFKALARADVDMLTFVQVVMALSKYCNMFIDVTVEGKIVLSLV